MTANFSAKNLAAQSKMSQYGETVVNFVNKEQGRFIAVTEDQSFISLVRMVLAKQLGIARPDIFKVEHDAVRVLKAIKEADEAGYTPLLFMERVLNGQDTTITVKQLKTAFPKTFIIILAVEMDQQRILYLHESGADNFIAKPISAQAVIEKMAFTIKPQNQLGQLLDKAKDYLRQNRPDMTKEIAKQVLEMKAHSPAGLIVLGDAEMAMNNIEAAKAAYSEAHEHAQLYLEPLARLAMLEETAGNMTESLKFLEKLDALSPLNTDRKLSMGEINLSLGNEEKAEALFEEAIELVAKETRDRIGDMSARVAHIYSEKSPEKSEKYLRKALDVKQNRFSRHDLRIFNQLGMSLRRQGKWQDAVNEYMRALQIVKDDENLLYNLSLAYADGGMTIEARKYMEQALKKNDSLPYASPAVAYRMGMVFLNGGDRTRATRCLEIALELKPGMPKALEAMTRLQ